jgi:hypothetical protein
LKAGFIVNYLVGIMWETEKTGSSLEKSAFFGARERGMLTAKLHLSRLRGKPLVDNDCLVKDTDDEPPCGYFYDPLWSHYRSMLFIVGPS